MRLINAQSHLVEEFLGDDVPPYYILSHRWGNDETTYKDFVKGRRHDSVGHKKIVDCCRFALQLHRQLLSSTSAMTPIDSRNHDPCQDCYVWIDTCCIDRKSSVELSEAINSMYDYYQRAKMCFAHLNDVIIGAEASPTLGAGEQDDVSSSDEAEESTTGSNASSCQEGSRSNSSDASSNATIGEELVSSLCGLGVPKASTTDPVPPNSLAHQFTQSSWFTRGWILQELLAPDQVIFLDRHWNIIGRKREDTNPLEEVKLGYDSIDEAPSLSREISNITGIGEAYLLNRDTIRDASIAERMSWASRRSTTRIEDSAYCLLGLFNVSLPLLYGEGSRAFLRLQQELIRQTNDQSIFAWWPTEQDFQKVNVEATLMFGRWARYFTTPILAPSPLYFQHSGGISRSAANTAATRPYAITNAGLELRAKVRALRLEDTYSSMGDSQENTSKLRLRKRHSKDKVRTYTVKLNCARETYTEQGVVEKKPFEIALHGAASDFPDEVILAARLHCLDESFWREARRGVGDDEVERERTFYVHALEHYHGKDLAMFPIP